MWKLFLKVPNMVKQVAMEMKKDHQSIPKFVCWMIALSTLPFLLASCIVFGVLIDIHGEQKIKVLLKGLVRN